MLKEKLFLIIMIFLSHTSYHYCYRVQLRAEKTSNKRPYLSAALNPFLYL